MNGNVKMYISNFKWKEENAYMVIKFWQKKQGYGQYPGVKTPRSEQSSTSLTIVMLLLEKYQNNYKYFIHRP